MAEEGKIVDKMEELRQWSEHIIWKISEQQNNLARFLQSSALPTGAITFPISIDSLMYSPSSHTSPKLHILGVILEP